MLTDGGQKKGRKCSVCYIWRKTLITANGCLRKLLYNEHFYYLVVPVWLARVIWTLCRSSPHPSHLGFIIRSLILRGGVTSSFCVWPFGITHVWLCDTFLAATNAFVDTEVDGRTVEWILGAWERQRGGESNLYCFMFANHKSFAFYNSVWKNLSMQALSQIIYCVCVCVCVCVGVFVCESLMRILFDVVSLFIVSQIMDFSFSLEVYSVMNNDLHQTCPLVKCVSLVFSYWK